MAKLFINPSSVAWGAEHVVGDVFTVEVRVTDVVDCYGVQFGVKWDSTVLELVEAPVKGDFLEATGVTTWFYPYSEAGYALCAYLRFQATSGVNISSPNSGLVATLKFKTLKTNATTPISFVPTDSYWFDSAFTSYAFTELVPATFTFGVIPPKYDLTITSTAGGTTNPAPATYSCDAGSAVTVTAVPNSGYNFNQWQLDGVVRAENPINVTMDKDHTLLAVFSVAPPPAYPKLTIVNITPPTVPMPAGQTFDFLTDWRNDAEAGTAWTRLIDLATSTELSPKTEFQVGKEQTGTIKHTVTMPNKDLRLRVEIGHVE